MNIVAWRDLFDKYRKEIIQSRLLMVEGKLQIEGEVIHIVVKRCFNISKLLKKLIPFSDEYPPLDTLMRSDETSSPGPDTRDKSQTKLFQENVFHEGRNFR
jgi:error-prone DNA polymerase